MIRLVLAVLIACTTTAYLFAKDSEIQQDLLSMSIKCPEQVTVGNKFVVEYQLTYPGDLSDKDLNISLTTRSELASLLIDIPATSNSFTTNVINGKINKISSKKWAFTFRANYTGRFTTPCFAITEGNDTLSISSINKLIEITKDNKRIENTNYDENKTDTTQVITRLELDKNTIQLGDSLVLKVILLSNCSGINSLTYIDTPMIEDCYLDKLIESTSEPSEEIINQCKYYKWIIGEYIAIPLKKGVFKIDPVRFKGEKWIREPLNDSFWGTLKNVPFETQSNRMIFNVE